MFTAMLAVRLRLGEIGVIVFQFLVLIAVTELAMNVGVVFARLRRFLLNCAFASVAVVLVLKGHAVKG